MPDIRDTLGIADVNIEDEKGNWSNEPSTVAEYSEGIGSLEVEPKDEKGVNWFAAVASQPKIIGEYFAEVLPGARRILSPLGSVVLNINQAGLKPV